MSQNLGDGRNMSPSESSSITDEEDMPIPVMNTRSRKVHKLSDSLCEKMAHVMENMTPDDMRFKTRIYRSLIPAIMERDEKLESRFCTENFSFRNTLYPISSSDSNVTGTLFVFDIEEYVGRKIKGLPPRAVIKVVPYEVDTDGRGRYTGDRGIDNKRDPANVEAMALGLFRDHLILKDVCPNIVLLYKYFTADDFTSFGFFMEAFSKLRDSLYESQTVLPQCKVIISEYCEGGSMRRWRCKKRSLVEWKSVLFMVLYTVSVMNNHLLLRHNDLHQANVLISTYAPDVSRFFCYKINGNTYYLPCVGVFPKVWDFDWCFAPQILENRKVTQSSQQHKGNRDMMLKADVHRFMNHIYSTRRGYTPSEVTGFIEQLFSKEYLGKSSTQLRNYQLMHNADLRFVPTALDCLQHPFFAEFRTPQAMNSIVTPVYKCPDLVILQ